MQSSPEREKVSISSHYRHVCCPFCKDGFKHGNKRKGAQHNKKKSISNHRYG